MNPIRVLGFGGAALAQNPKLLPETVGVNVVDAEPGGGELKPLKARTTVATVPTGTQQRSIYRMGRDAPNDALYWLSWPTDVHVVRGIDPADTTERILFAGSGTPKWTNNAIGLGGGPPYPQATRELAVPAPIVAPVVVLNTDGPGTAEQGTVYWVETFVNDLGWESAQGPISTGVVAHAGATFDISALEAAPAGTYGITGRRLYRTQPGTTDAAANFFYYADVPIATTSLTTDGRALDDELATIGWVPPPASAFDILDLWNGFYALLSGKTVSFTEPGSPYTAPVKYDQEVSDTPVRLAKWEQNLLVLTTGRSRLFRGQDPLGMSEVPAYAGQPIISSRSVVMFPFGVVWASNEGIAFSDSPNVISLKLWKPPQWRALRPETIIAGRYGRHYVASYDDGAGRKAFMVDPLRPDDGAWFLSVGFDACWYDELADALYVLEGGNVRKFDSGAPLVPTFRSKVFHQVAPRNFGWAKVVADVYPVTLKVWSETKDAVTQAVTMVLRTTRSIANADPITLPGGFTSEDWQIEVTGGPVQAVHLATDLRDFREG